MSKTFTRKVFKGVIAKKEAELRKQTQLLEEEERKEADLWKIGAKDMTKQEQKLQKEKEKELLKEKLKEKYEKEMTEYD